MKTQTRMRSKARRLRTAELSGGVLNMLHLTNHQRCPNSNKTYGGSWYINTLRLEFKSAELANIERRRTLFELP